MEARQDFGKLTLLKKVYTPYLSCLGTFLVI